MTLVCEHKEDAFLYKDCDTHNQSCGNPSEFSQCEMKACVDCGEITEECELYNCPRGEYQ